MFCYRAWFRTFSENQAVAHNILSVLEYFKEIDGREYKNFMYFPNFLWQVGRFEESVFHCHRVYDATVRAWGADSMEAGLIAMYLGGCYFNGNRVKESIPWYHRALTAMQNSGAGDSEDLGMAYEKVARCYTWEYDRDFEKSEVLFKESLRIRQAIVDAFLRGETPVRMADYVPHNLDAAYALLGEVYMEMGRMYQAKGDWATACEYVQKDLELIFAHRPEDVSGIAYGYFDKGACYYHMALETSDGGERTRLLSDAEEQFTRAMDINMKMRGALAIDTIDNQEFLADVYTAQGRMAEASNAYMAVLTMVENLLGSNHPRIAKVKAKMDFR